MEPGNTLLEALGVGNADNLLVIGYRDMTAPVGIAVAETVYNALELTQLSAFQKAGFSDSVYIGIIANTPRLPACQDYLDYLISIG